MNNELAAKCLVSGVLTLPHEPGSLKQVIESFPFPNSKPKEIGSPKERSFWISQQLISLWWPYRKVFRNEQDGFKVLMRYDAQAYFSDEMHSYLVSRFHKHESIHILKRMIARYLASVSLFFESQRDNVSFQLLRKEAEAIRLSDKNPGEEVDPLILPINFIFAVPDVIHLFVSAIACLERKIGRHALRKEVESIQASILPIIMVLSMHHNTSAGESLRYLLGEGGLSMYDTFSVEANGEKHRVSVSEIALAHISKCMKDSGLYAARILLAPDQFKRMEGLRDRMHVIFDYGNAEQKALLTDEDHKIYGQIFRTILMASAARNGVESVGCPLSFVKGDNHENAMISFSREVMSSFTEYLYQKI